MILPHIQQESFCPNIPDLKTHSAWNNLGYKSPSSKQSKWLGEGMCSFSWSLECYRQFLWKYMKPYRKSGALEKEDGTMDAREANQQTSTLPV